MVGSDGCLYFSSSMVTRLLWEGLYKGQSGAALDGWMDEGIYLHATFRTCPFFMTTYSSFFTMYMVS